MRGFTKVLLVQLLFGALLFSAKLSSQTGNTPPDPVRSAVARLDFDRFKSHISGMAQFGDRIQGSERNRNAIDWLEKQLRSFGYSNVVRQRFISASGPLENIY